MERGGVADTNVESRGIAAKDSREVQLLHFLLQPRGKAGVHAGASGEDDVFVEVGADVDGCGLDGSEKHF